MEFKEEDYLAHYGVLRRSGRYPWGSGDNATTHTPPRNMNFNDEVKWLKARGVSEPNIAKGYGLTVKQLRAEQSIESNAARQANIVMAQRLKDKGYSPTAISRRMEAPESTVRSWLAPGAKDKTDIITNTANMLKSHVSKDVYLDVGKGTEYFADVSRTRMDTAIEVLKQAGYTLHLIKAPQVTAGYDTRMKVLAEPGVTWADVNYNRNRITQIQKFSNDGGRTFSGELREPISVDHKRIEVVYGPDGGSKADGMIYVRPGVEDINIGGSNYAQVRVAVGKDHFLKGMAMYKDDLPDGTDIQFYTSKSDTGNKLDAMKLNKDEKGYVEGGPHVLLKSIKRQILSDQGTDKERLVSAMNLVNEEGKWEDWGHELSSQMLSKQQPILAKSQLNMTYERRQNELEGIMRLTNNTVKKKMLWDFAEATDAAAVHLKAAALPRTANHVILPLSKIKRTEIYAPNYKQGEKVVLVRHPHGGVFELPELVVNNRNPEGRNLLGSARDAIGIHHTVAQWLSGADFDGDTVLVIPNNAERVKHSSLLSELKDFDPRSSYPPWDGMKKMTNTQNEMGRISNLLADMSLRNAPQSDIASAIKHSMVVIDAEKHNLDYKLSENDNGIKQLRKKYQTGGASTLITRAGSPVWIPEQKARLRGEGGRIDVKTGAKVTVPTGKVNWKTQELKKTKRDRLAITTDARTLMSSPTGTPMERIYADHSNKLKALANTARLAEYKTPAPKASPSAKKTYKTEVDSLNSKLAIAKRNAPLERQAQLIANSTVRMRKQADPNMDEDTEKKIRYQALTQARIRTGAHKDRIKFTDEEWDAIQAGAISHSKLNEMLNNADMDNVRAHATPKVPLLMTNAKTVRAKQMLAQGYSREDVANHLGVSLSTLDNAT